jgi:hypothetical protein
MPKPHAPIKAEKARPSITHAKVLEHYRSFLLRDCGQMTIEGVHADMDTAQRRFDLELLFVPLTVLPTPPDIPMSDPEREQKLARWQQENNKPIPFGQVFKNRRRLALLALPGGGKSLLLKRIAVAYADSTRRQKSNDSLPELDLIPVLIRCREWREHIRRPIFALLQDIAAVTGQPSLSELSDALIPLLKKGRVLLLIDGLDEIQNDADRSTFVKHLEDFLQEYGSIRVVVTSREAGFALVAPSVARFCDRWRLAPLDEPAITALCHYWHRLMKGDMPEAKKEGVDLSSHLLRSEPLRRLAENPLLLTMLLVVKHGAGRLPPDRVSLYERAVEVLLDTWNIQGHDPLNRKEAVPQLAYVAFQLMRQGKQTATEGELLTLLEEGREKVPQIRRYAKDSSDQFLKRVELRSSLLVEAGHQLEGARAVPFYQFRHLTFQEYLAAVAAVEGHYMEYQKDDTVLTPLEPYLTSEEWKEVIPMAAVLAEKQAEPLMAALVTKGNLLRREMETGNEFSGKPEWLRHQGAPAVAERLLQCLGEEAEASSDIVNAALQIVALFSMGMREPFNLSSLIHGPYGDELLHQIWLLYAPMTWPRETLLRNTFATVAASRYPKLVWKSAEGQAELLRLLRSQKTEENAVGLMTVASLEWGPLGERNFISVPIPLPDVESYLFKEEPALLHAAEWACGLIYRREESVEPSPTVLDRLLALWLSEGNASKYRLNASFALARLAGRPRQIWTPLLTEMQKQFLREGLDPVV